MQIARILGTMAMLACVTAAARQAITTPAVARQQPSSSQPQLSGAARIAGRVVADDNGRPVRRAPISLSGLPDSQRQAGSNRVYVSRRVETDVHGRFDFTDLPAGWYSIHVDAVNGFVRPARREITLTEGQAVDQMIRLVRAGAIEGRIEDDNGDRVLGARVQAVRKFNVGGHSALGFGGLTTTNDLGEFRLSNLPAGEYYLVAARPTWTRNGAGSRTEAAPRTGYADTYYPGAPALQGARAVVVRSGRDSERVNFTIASCRLATLSINPVDSRGAPLGPDAQMVLTKRNGVYLDWSTNRTSRREGGTFQFDGIQPGDYHLVVTTSSNMEEGAYVNVSVRDADMSLRVQTNAGATVSGRIIIDGRPADDLSRHVSVASMQPPGTYGVLYARERHVRADPPGRFELTGLRGPTVLHAEVSSGALVSIRRGSEEMAGKTLDFAGTETVNDVVVELTTQVAQVDVTVTNASTRGEPEPVLVFVFAEDPARWHQGFLQYANTIIPPRSATGGPVKPVSTEMGRLPAGRYLVAAVPDEGVSHPMAGGALEKLRALATPVTLVAGQTAKVTVAVVRTTR